MAEGKKEEYLNLSNFDVSIDGLKSTHFDYVGNLGIDFEDIAFDGGKNAMHNKPGRFVARDITLRRPYRSDKEFIEWLKKQKEGKKESSYKNGSVRLLDDDNNEVVRFNFEKAWIKAWSGPVLSKDRAGNDVLREEIVLSVQDLELKA